MRVLGRIGLGAILPIAVFIIWWFTSKGSTSPYFPPLSDSVHAFFSDWFFERFTSDLVPTIIWFYSGLAIGAVVGVALGILMGLYARLRRDLWPMTEFVRSIPTAGLVPLFLLFFGAGFWMETLLCALAVFFQVLISTIDAVHGIDPVQVEVARVYGLSKRQSLRVILLPAAMPQVMAGLRIGISIGLAAVIIANMVASSEGLGFFLINAQTTYDIPGMWGALFLIGILGFLVNAVFLLFQHRVLAWHRGWRATTRAAK
ncbi:MAG TPA: ABC transporter permease [Trebonia sp.]|nr:ABC transporter permease [Trebonia sp.]